MKTAMYKGKKYILEFAGKTKFGERAKLKFFSGEKSFWVALNLVSEISGESERESWKCSRCRKSMEKDEYDAYDGVCWDCQSQWEQWDNM